MAKDEDIYKEIVNGFLTTLKVQLHSKLSPPQLKDVIVYIQNLAKLITLHTQYVAQIQLSTLLLNPLQPSDASPRRNSRHLPWGKSSSKTQNHHDAGKISDISKEITALYAASAQAGNIEALQELIKHRTVLGLPDQDATLQLISNLIQMQSVDSISALMVPDFIANYLSNSHFSDALLSEAIKTSLNNPQSENARTILKQLLTSGISITELGNLAEQCSADYPLKDVLNGLSREQFDFIAKAIFHGVLTNAQLSDDDKFPLLKELVFKGVIVTEEMLLTPASVCTHGELFNFLEAMHFVHQAEKLFDQDPTKARECLKVAYQNSRYKPLIDEYYQHQVNPFNNFCVLYEQVREIAVETVIQPPIDTPPIPVPVAAKQPTYLPSKGGSLVTRQASQNQLTNQHTQSVPLLPPPPQALRSPRTSSDGQIIRGRTRRPT